MIEDKNLKAEFQIAEQTVVNGIVHTRAAEKDYFDYKFEFGQKLGQGAFGMVQVAADKHTGLLYACKTVKKMAGSTTAYEQVMREIEVMKKTNHPNIVRLIEVLETPKKIYLILEYCEGGELVGKIRKMPEINEEDCRTIIGRLADAIAYLHKIGIVHRDIKPENILISTDNPNDPWNIKVSDFGLATSTNACAMMDNIVGTPLYMAPEIVKNSGYSAQCDVWSIGILMYLLLCGYTKEVETDLIKMIQRSDITYPEKYWSDIPESAKHLVDMMLRIDPAKRISANEILRHPWITGKDLNGSDFALNQNVLDLMKSYNAERRLRKVMWVVRIALRWRNVSGPRAKQRGGADSGDSSLYKTMSGASSLAFESHSMPRATTNKPAAMQPSPISSTKNILQTDSQSDLTSGLSKKVNKMTISSGTSATINALALPIDSSPLALSRSPSGQLGHKPAGISPAPTTSNLASSPALSSSLKAPTKASTNSASPATTLAAPANLSSSPASNNSLHRTGTNSIQPVKKTTSNSPSSSLVPAASSPSSDTVKSKVADHANMSSTASSHASPHGISSITPSSNKPIAPEKRLGANAIKAVTDSGLTGLKKPAAAPAPGPSAIHNSTTSPSSKSPSKAAR